MNNKDLKMMKVLHDLKNPIIALISTIYDKSLDIKGMRIITNADLKDIDEMLDNLKTEFKSKQNLDSKEQKRDVDTIKFLENIDRAQNRIAKNGNNNFTINADTIFSIYSKYLKSVFKEYVTI